MNRRSPVLGALGLAAACMAVLAGGARAQDAPYPPVTIPDTELRALHSTATGRDYDLYVYRSAQIAADRSGRYPVLYLLDGQWDFKLLASIHGGLRYDRFVPDAIIVGITYSGAHANYDSLRALDYTPVAAPATPGSGGAPRFLEFLERELIPFIEAEYPADPGRRAIMGNSLGGLFALHAMFAAPGLFHGYVAGSPAVTYAQRGAFAEEASYAQGHTSLAARLFVSVGSDEPLAAPVAEYVKALRARGYGDLELEYRVIQGERHSSNKPEALNRGLRFLFGGS